LAHGSPDLLFWRKAGNHQGESGSCVVLASSEDDEPLWNHSPVPKQPQDQAIPKLKPQNPPPQYPTGTAKKIASVERKFASTEHTYFFICSPSKEKVSKKPIQYLPKTDKPCRQIA
jgi:hypothetical protein